LLLAAAALAALFGFVRPIWLASGLAVPVVVLAGWVLWFFRDPPRRCPDEPRALISPADGLVTDLTPIGADSALGRTGVRIGIFMNIFDVHVNRSPLEATVKRVEHRPGVLLDARDPAASDRNEAMSIYLSCRRGGQDWPLVVRQIAGKIARRIVTDVVPGQVVARGQRIGMIKFGSRVEVLLCDELAGEMRVAIGQRVKAGSTVLARLKH
jgi:phosphatidylserine decarboxylase